MGVAYELGVWGDEHNRDYGGYNWKFAVGPQVLCLSTLPPANKTPQYWAHQEMVWQPPGNAKRRSPNWLRYEQPQQEKTR